MKEMERLIRDRLAQPLPGTDGHLLMSPRPRHGWDPGEIPADSRPGAGLLLLYPHRGEPHLVLTLRQGELRAHGGQVSLPGGAVEAGESFAEAALREASEEVGVDPGSVRVLGMLSPLHIPVSGFALHPVLAISHRRPDLRPDPLEVARILEVAVGHLHDPARRGTLIREHEGRQYEVPYFSVDGEQVWGATAMVLAEFLCLLDAPAKNGRDG